MTRGFPWDSLTPVRGVHSPHTQPSGETGGVSHPLSCFSPASPAPGSPSAPPGSVHAGSAVLHGAERKQRKEGKGCDSEPDAGLLGPP